MIAAIHARADYAWIPEYKVLRAQAAFEFSSTSGNFDNSGTSTDLSLNGDLISILDTRFKLGLEYGMAQSWSIGIATGFQTSHVDAAQAANAVTGYGLIDSTFFTKWNVSYTDPVITLEGYMTAPAMPRNVDITELAMTQGAFDFGFKVHTGHQAGSFLLSFSPGARLRSGGFSPALTADGAIDLRFTRGYARVFGEYVYSIEATQPLSTSDDVQDAPGTFGSYSRLNASPIGLSAGGQVGIKIYRDLFLEGGGRVGVMGTRYPRYFSGWAGLRCDFDFFQKVKPRRVRDVPFEEDDEDR